MTQRCPLKTALIISQLDELQEGWRKGDDVKKETKEAIVSHAIEKYRPVLQEFIENPDESISIKSIENAIGRARKELKIFSPKGRRNSPVRGSSTDEIELQKKKDKLKEKLKKIMAELQKEMPGEWKQIIQDSVEALENEPQKLDSKE